MQKLPPGSLPRQKHLLSVPIWFYNYIDLARGMISFYLYTDVVSIPKRNENFRLLYDTKGRFRLHSIRDDEAKVLFIWFILNIVIHLQARCYYTIIDCSFVVFSYLIYRLTNVLMLMNLLNVNFRTWIVFFILFYFVIIYF